MQSIEVTFSNIQCTAAHWVDHIIAVHQSEWPQPGATPVFSPFYDLCLNKEQDFDQSWKSNFTTKSNTESSGRQLMNVTHPYRSPHTTSLTTIFMRSQILTVNRSLEGGIPQHLNICICIISSLKQSDDQDDKERVKEALLVVFYY